MGTKVKIKGKATVKKRSVKAGGSSTPRNVGGIMTVKVAAIVKKKREKERSKNNSK